MLLHFRKVLIKGILLAFLVLPQFTQAQTAVGSDVVYRAALLQLIELLQVQVSFLQTELADRVQTQAEILVRSDSVEDTLFSQSVDKVAVYQITTMGDVSGILERKHRLYFQRIFALFPDLYDQKISQLMVFKGDSSFDAFVETVPPDHKSWSYAVSDTMLEDIYSAPSTELIVHELGHLVSYEDILGVPSPRISHCDDYFKQSGCPSESSFLNKFVDRFWSEDDLSRASRFADSNDLADLAYDYYQAQTDDFVTDYAARSPEEDFAESLTFFVLDEQVEGALARRKVDFFGQYPELNELKEEVSQER